ncbi:MAG TPA: ABC transporter ATP-binding protein [Ruminiclostridium sp.]|nr:ABC transporter ATP-binding protein [Ruminiclostridium sp.]
MSKIVLENIDKFYGTNHVLKGLNLTVDDGEFMTLLGPSGCGKTTTLRVIAGLEKPQNGYIHMDGREVVNAAECFFESPSKRGLNLVFQSYALWPHMTVFDNVAFGLTIKKLPKEEIKLKVHNALERLRIMEYVGRYPSELSGGQQQRVAIARAIVSEPKVLLLDEPLSNLDAKLRIEMRSELKRLHRELGTTVIYVTHDQVEALTMSTRIAIFFDGVLEQVDDPMGVYQNPISLKVADFIGNPRINFIDGKGEVRGDTLIVTSELGTMSFPREDFTEYIPDSGQIGCVLGLRPEQILIQKEAVKDGIPAKVYSGMPAGSETLVQLTVGKESLLAKEIGLAKYEADQEVWLEINSKKINVFDKETGKLIKFAELE